MVKFSSKSWTEHQPQERRDSEVFHKTVGSGIASSLESKNRISQSLRSEQKKKHVLCWPKNLSERGLPRRKASVPDNRPPQPPPPFLLLKSLPHCLSRPMQALTSECFISVSGLGVGMTSREGLAKKDQRLWEMPPSQPRESFPDAGIHSSASPPSSAPSPAMPAYHRAWFTVRKLDTTCKRKGVGDGILTHAAQTLP